mgnify:CR=1 FL=1
MRSRSRLKAIPAIIYTALLILVCASGPFHEAPSDVKSLIGSAPVTEVTLSCGTYPVETTELTAVIQSEDVAKLDALSYLTRADFSGSSCVDEIYQWAQAHPDVKVKYTVTLPDGQVLSSSEQSLDLSELTDSAVSDTLTDSAVDGTVQALAYLPKVSSIQLGSERSDLGWDSVRAIMDACPNASVSYAFWLYDKEFSTVDTTINLSHIPVEDDGAQVMQAMACMPNLVSVDMDSCGVSNEDMAAIRDAYPDVKVIWRVWFGDAYSVRTDVERILASQPSHGGMLDRYNSEALKYCTDVKYLDVGHNDALDDISFVAYMPKLEVAILAMDNWSDATPLASCTELEYLEMQTTLCTDLSPLSGLKNLRHLNIAYIVDLEDISPLYSLTELERLWVGCYNHVPAEQIDEMRAAAPNCEVNDTVYDDPTGGRWRYVDYNDKAYIFILHPRYEKLREQFGYTSADFAFYWNDPLY